MLIQSKRIKIVVQRSRRTLLIDLGNEEVLLVAITKKNRGKYQVVFGIFRCTYTIIGSRVYRSCYRTIEIVLNLENQAEI